jgi:hypothetical protein
MKAVGYVRVSFRRLLEKTRDYQEGIRAHFEKRAPVFNGT